MIETKNLTKKFGNFTAVENLSLSIDHGESYGFLGPNGSGKTTTILMLLGVLKPTSGEVKIEGQSVQTDSFNLKKKIGVVAEYQKYYDEMTAWEYIQFFADLYEVADKEAKANLLFDRLGLEKWKNVLIKGYSTGMQKKLGFARALIHSPQLLILDEPVSGLDPFSITQVRELLLDVKSKGCALLISSHILSEIEKLVDRVGIIYKGNLIAQDTMQGLRHMVGQRNYLQLSFKTINQAQIQTFAALSFVKKIETTSNQLKLFIDQDTEEYRAEIGQLILKNDLVVLELEKKEPNLEETFITITENNFKQIADQVSSTGEKNE
jgi:ABC-2 type transport system ATP-binding protein